MFIASLLTFSFCLIVALMVATVRTNTFRFWVIIGFITAIFYSLIYGMRTFDSGSDTEYYRYAFENIEYLNTYWECGFLYVTKMLFYFSTNPRVYVYALSLMNCIFVMLASIFLCDGKWFSVPLIQILTYSTFAFFDLTTNGLRQGIGLSLAMVGVVFCIKKSKKIGYLILLLAFSCHASVILLIVSMGLTQLFINPLKKYKAIEKVFSLGLFLLILLIAFGIDLLPIEIGIIEKLPLFDRVFFLRKVANALEAYSSISIGSFRSLNILGKIQKILGIATPIIIFLCCKKKFRSKNINILFVYCFYGIIFVSYSFFAYQGFSYRYLYVLNIISPILLYETMISNKINTSRHISFILIILASTYAVIFIWFSKQGQLISYG